MTKLKIFLPVLGCLLLAACRTLPPPPRVVTALSGPERIDADGGLHFDITAGAFLTNGFSVSDTVVVALAGNEVSMPVVAAGGQVAAGEFALVAPPEPTRPIFATIFHGDAAACLGIAHQFSTVGGALKVWKPVTGLSFPLPVVIRLERKGEAPAASASEPVP